MVNEVYGETCILASIDEQSKCTTRTPKSETWEFLQFRLQLQWKLPVFRIQRASQFLNNVSSVNAKILHVAKRPEKVVVVHGHDEPLRTRNSNLKADVTDAVMLEQELIPLHLLQNGHHI